MPSKKRIPAPEVRQSPEIPDWVTKTPKTRNPRGSDPTGYELAIFGNGSDEQYIKITRAEYIALKRHLATLRGYAVPGEN